MADGIAGATIIPLSEFSDLQLERLKYAIPHPPALLDISTAQISVGDATAARSAHDFAALSSWFPRTYGKPIINFTPGAASNGLAASVLRVGVVFCGRQSPGASNVVAGLFDALQHLNPANELVGFIGGTKGLFDGKHLKVTAELLASYRNQGGFHLLGRSVDKIRTESEQRAALATANSLKLHGLVLIGGPITNSDAGHLAEYFTVHQEGDIRTAVIGVPVSIDGDLKNQFVETTLGFDTATKVYAQLVGNMATDANSAKKYTYFVRLMGRSYGHIATEVALQTQPNYVVLGEDIEHRKLTLSDIVRELADLVSERAAANRNFGVILVAEGAISAIPEIRTLIAEMNHLFQEGVDPSQIASKLTPWSSAVLAYLPQLIRQQLFLERESSGAVQLSQISTERMLAELVGLELEKRKAAGLFKGKYASITHFFGYQARSSLPSNFDCAYADALGRTAAGLVAAGHSGYLATVRSLSCDVSEWQPVGIPITAMMSTPAATLSHSHSMPAKDGATLTTKVGLRPVIPSAPVDISGGPFSEILRRLPVWKLNECYANPGPIQFHGPAASLLPLTLTLDRHDYMDRIAVLRKQLEDIKDICRPGVSESLLDAAVTGVTSLVHILQVMKRKE